MFCFQLKTYIAWNKDSNWIIPLEEFKQSFFIECKKKEFHVYFEIVFSEYVKGYEIKTQDVAI